RLLEAEPALAQEVAGDLQRWGGVVALGSLPGAWVKHAAQGSALVADGLAGGRWAPLVERLALGEANGGVWGGWGDPRAGAPRARCLGGAGGPAKGARPPAPPPPPPAPARRPRPAAAGAGPAARPGGTPPPGTPPPGGRGRRSGRAGRGP